MKTKLIIVRHAEAVGNMNRRFHGWTDEGITDRGEVQAKLVAERLKDTQIDIIYSSTLKRTMETAAYISQIKELPINSRDDLKEINGGLWEDVSWSELTATYPEEYKTWETQPHIHQMPQGENVKSFYNRLISAVSDILAKEEGKNVCILTHGTAIRALLCWFKGLPLEDMVEIPWCDNTAITIITSEQGKFVVEAEGDSSHLDKTTSTFQNQEWYLEYIKNMNKQD